MKVFFCFLLFFSTNGQAQQALWDSVNVKHDLISKKGLLVLSGWSVANITTGLIGQQNNVGPERQFHKRNVIWGGVNLGIAQISYWSLHRKRTNKYTVAQTLKRTETTEKLFLFNTGLDLGYIAFGLYNRERANRYTGEKRDRIKGTGSSLILQGAFLTLFDGGLYLLHAKNGNRLSQKLSTLSFSSGSNGLSLIYPL